MKIQNKLFFKDLNNQIELIYKEKFQDKKKLNLIKIKNLKYNIKIDSESIDDSTVFSGSFPHHNLNIALITVFDALKMKYNKNDNRNIKLRY